MPCAPAPGPAGWSPDALTFYQSEAYRAAREIRLRCAEASVVAMEGLPS